MSVWYEIKDPEDVELSEDGKTVDVLFRGDRDGNHYIEIPIEFVRKLVQSDASKPAVQADDNSEPCEYFDYPNFCGAKNGHRLT